MRGKSFPISLLFLTLSWPIRKILSHLWKRSSLFQSSLSYFDRTIPHPKYFIKNLPLQITFPPPRLYNSSVSHFEMAHRENKNGYLSFHFYLSEIRTRVLARPIKKRYLYFPPHSCWISLFHAYSSRARNWIFLGAAEAPAAKSGTKLFSLDERTLIAFIMLWCKTRVRNLSPAGFETSTPAPTSLVVRPFHRIFSSFHLYIRTIYILYTGNEDFLRRLWRCSGFFEDRHDHGGKYGWLASSDKRMWKRWGEEGPFARKGEKGREGETLINFI